MGTVRPGKQRATNIIRQVFAFSYLEDRIMTLRNNKFSIIIDENTDQINAKKLAIMASFFYVKSFEIKTYLLDMVEGSDGTAQGIYKALEDSFEMHSIPMENIVRY